MKEWIAGTARSKFLDSHWTGRTPKMMYHDVMRWKVSKLQIWQQPRTFSRSMASLSSKMSWVLLSVVSLRLTPKSYKITLCKMISLWWFDVMSYLVIWHLKSPPIFTTRWSHCGRDLDFTGRAHRRTSASSDGKLVLVIFGTLWTPWRTGLEHGRKAETWCLG